MQLRMLYFVLSLQICFITASRTSPSVIIVGAGAAGVAATTRLLEHGFENITVLEAENRVGGRIYSIFFGDAYVDLGAEWCHGEKGNIVYDLVKDFNILRHTGWDGEVYHYSKKNVDKELIKELLGIMFQYHFSEKQNPEGISLGQLYIEKYNSTIYEKYGNNSEKLEIAKDVFDHFHHVLISYDGAFSWFDSSAKQDFKDCEGDPDLNWNGLGFKTILEVLMKKFPDPSKQLPFDEKVLLNKEVVKVLWNESSTVSVVCSDGTVYQSDHIIFTPSVGVLKKRHEEIFSPLLPPNKKLAIERIGIGAVMKVLLHFENKWWSDSFLGFDFIWNEDDKTKMTTEFSKGPLKEGRSWLTNFFEILPAERNSNVVIAWFTGDMVSQIELMDSEILKDGIIFTLNKFVGHKYNISQPDSILRTSWYANPHFRGTYSFQTIESRKGNVSAEVDLAKPLLNEEGRPIVMFAGEATHPYFYSTVHGAIETGHREADRIINLYK